MKLAHSRLTGSLGDRETSGPAPSRDNVAKQADGERVKGESTKLSVWPHACVLLIRSGFII